MNIVRENTGELTAQLKLSIAPEVYKPMVEKSLKEARKKVAMPGFRPGMVPAGMIKKMYGKSVLAEELNKIVSDQIEAYLKENNINLIGSPLTSDAQTQLDFDTEGTFEFLFDIGIMPSVEVKLDSSLVITKYNIVANDKMIEEVITDIKRRYGKPDVVESAEEKDMVYGKLEELNEDGSIKEGGIMYQTWMSAEYTKDDTVKKALTGCKKDDAFTLVPFNVTQNERGAVALIGQKGENVPQIHNTFKFTVESITRITPAELNEELYKKVYPADTINTEEEFMERVKKELSDSYNSQTERQVMSDVMETLMKSTSVNLPEEFLKRWLKEQKEIDAQKIDEEFDKYKDALKWQIIENELIKAGGIAVSQNDVKEYFKENLRKQFAQYNLGGEQSEAMESSLDAYAQRALENKETVKNAYDNLFDTKIQAYVLSNITVETVDISYDDYIKKMTEKK